jgi:hypothetical protein
MSTIDWSVARVGQRRLPIPIHNVKNLDFVAIRGELIEMRYHWIPAGAFGPGFRGRSAAHFRNDCRNCRFGETQIGYYGPALLWSLGSKRWLTVILSLNNSFFDAVSKIPNFDSQVLELKIEKAANRKNEYLARACESWGGKIPSIEPFDVVPHLEALWGIGDSVQAAAPANVVAAKPNVLKFPPARAG